MASRKRPPHRVRQRTVGEPGPQTPRCAEDPCQSVRELDGFPQNEVSTGRLSVVSSAAEGTRLPSLFPQSGFGIGGTVERRGKKAEGLVRGVQDLDQRVRHVPSRRSSAVPTGDARDPSFALPPPGPSSSTYGFPPGPLSPRPPPCRNSASGECRPSFQAGPALTAVRIQLPPRKPVSSSLEPVQCSEH